MLFEAEHSTSFNIIQFSLESHSQREGEAQFSVQFKGSYYQY